MYIAMTQIGSWLVGTLSTISSTLETASDSEARLVTSGSSGWRGTYAIYGRRRGPGAIFTLPLARRPVKDDANASFRCTIYWFYRRKLGITDIALRAQDIADTSVWVKWARLRQDEQVYGSGIKVYGIQGRHDDWVRLRYQRNDYNPPKMCFARILFYLEHEFVGVERQLSRWKYTSTPRCPPMSLWFSFKQHRTHVGCSLYRLSRVWLAGSSVRAIITWSTVVSTRSSVSSMSYSTTRTKVNRKSDRKETQIPSLSQMTAQSNQTSKSSEQCHHRCLNYEMLAFWCWNLAITNDIVTFPPPPPLPLPSFKCLQTL